MKKRIHIFGASGSGTTTIAKLVAKKLSYTHFDSDSYFWLPTDEPFTEQRPREECLSLMKNDLSTVENWILSGSITGWGDELRVFFDLVVFVYVKPDVRLKRLKKREFERYGNDALLGGNRYEDSQIFLEWASSYDTGTIVGRNLMKHRNWLAELDCQVLEIENDDLLTSVEAVLKAVK